MFNKETKSCQSSNAIDNCNFYLPDDKMKLCGECKKGYGLNNEE